MSTRRPTAARRLPRSRWLAAASSAAVALSLLVSAAPAQAAAKVSHLRSAATPATVIIGGKTTISGAVSPYVAGSPVVLQRLVAGHWKTLGHAKTSTKGTFSFSVKATGKPGTWTLRVLRAASSRATGVVGKKVVLHTTKTAYKVSASTITKVNSGVPVTFTGSVKPATTGKVYLQVLSAGKWRTLASGTLKSSTYKITKMLPAKAYALRVLKPLNTKIAQGESKPVKVTVYPVAPAATAKLALTSPDDVVAPGPGHRLIFSTVKAKATPARSVTFTNSGNAPVTVSGLAIQGVNASSFALAPGQPTAFTVAPGQSASVSVLFTPTAATQCPTTSNPYGAADINRDAGLVFTSTDAGLPGGSAALSGVNACDYSGANEPVLDQLISGFGYTDVVTNAKTDRRFIGQQPLIPGTDEIAAPYFRAANAAAPVSVIPLAQYSTTNTRPYHPIGWFAQGAAIGADGTCNASCHELWRFPGEASQTSFLQNQKLLPVPVGTETFTPGGTTFGLYSDEFTNVNWTDDRFNIAHQCSPSPDNCKNDAAPVTPTKLLHDMRVYPAFGPGHVVIPHEYLIAIDVSRLADKNNDFQDILLLVKNVVPAS